MSEVADCVLQSIKTERDETTLDLYPIDLVVTHPARWPETAVNLTVRAVTEAFTVAFSGVRGGAGAHFRHVSLATEPEACAQTTMKDAAKARTSNLRPGDCFVIVDAGGGTVVSESQFPRVVWRRCLLAFFLRMSSRARSSPLVLSA